MAMHTHAGTKGKIEPPGKKELRHWSTRSAEHTRKYALCTGV